MGQDSWLWVMLPIQPPVSSGRPPTQVPDPYR